MCGICGIFSIRCTEDCIEKMLECSVENLKHRGYDGYGVAIKNCDNTTKLSRRRTSTLQNNTSVTGQTVKEKYCMTQTQDYHTHHSKSKSRKRFPFYRPSKSSTYIGLAHTRYKTKGSCTIENAQPVLSLNEEIALVHNGQVKCGLDESEECLQSDTRHILNVFQREYNVNGENIFKSVKKVFDDVEGSYACVMNVSEKGLIAFRDPMGIRPLILGIQNAQIPNSDEFITALELVLDKGEDTKSIPKKADRVVFASESTIISSLGCTVVRDVRPGEAIWVDCEGNIQTYQYQTTKLTPCLFEYIYLADKHSTIDGINVNKARCKMGEILVPRLKSVLDPIDLVIPIPSTPNNAAKAIAKGLECSYGELIYVPMTNKSRKTTRTFILPTKQSRENAVKQKFSIHGEELLKLYQANEWKNLKHTHIALVDDSIVRGTTMRRIVELVKTHLTPRKITIVSLAPPIRYENYYGIDIPSRETLLAHNKTVSEISNDLDVHNIVYGDLDEIITTLTKLAFEKSVILNGMETSVFDESYSSSSSQSISELQVIPDSLFM